MLKENKISSMYQIFFIIFESCYKRCKFHYIFPQGDSKSVRYIRKFVISEFVITVTFNKDLLRILPGNQKNFVISVNSLYPCSY